MARGKGLVVQGLEGLKRRHLYLLAIGGAHGIVKVEEPRAHVDREGGAREFNRRKGVCD